MKIRKISIIFILIISLFLLTGCGEKKQNEVLNEKVEIEIGYLDKKIISIANLLNGISLQNYKIETREIVATEGESNNSQSSQSSGGNESSSESSNSSGGNNKSENEDEKNNGDENENKILISEMKTTSIFLNSNDNLDWDKIKFEIELLYGTWDTIILDLYKLNVQKEDVNSFSENLNNVTISIKNENKNDSLISLARLYALLPEYLNYCSYDNEKTNIMKTKLYLLNACCSVKLDDWEKVILEVNNAIDSFIPVVNNSEYVKGKEHLVNRIYIILNELKNSLTINDKDIFYINYKNVMNDLNVFD